MIVARPRGWCLPIVYDSYDMDLLVLLLGFGFFMLMRGRKHDEEQRRRASVPRLPPGVTAPMPMPPGMPPSVPGWVGPAAPAPAPPSSCATNQWHLPEYRDLPQDVIERAKQILVSTAPMGHELVEHIAGRVWKFKVEVHGANEMNPNPHRGVGVRICV